MLIVCPSCGSEHSIDSAYIGSVGRRVRCAACRTTWFVGPESEDATAEVDPFEAMMRKEQRAGQRETIPPAAEPPASEEPVPKKRLARQKAPRRAASRTLAAAFGAIPSGLASLLVAVAAITALLFARPAVVAAAPQAAGLYALIGLRVNLRGLEMRGVKSRIETSAGDPVLVVEGEIENVARGEVVVPPLEFVVRSVEGHPLYTWTNEPPRKTVEAGETVAFRARLATPPAEGRQVLVRFLAASESQAGAKAP